jgi:hypothetical protein
MKLLAISLAVFAAGVIFWLVDGDDVKDWFR